MSDYCNSNFEYSRLNTREVMVGNIGIGAGHPIRVQSMTTVSTMDTLGTVEQVKRMLDAGCEIFRITAPTPKDASNLKHIKEELLRRGISVPLVADIHFNPNAAMVAAEHVEKVRINPGNYADSKSFKSLEYSDQEYSLELDRIYEKFSPLVKKLKDRDIALRIGTNHGSLSDRIMSRFGDTPKGMVESALEFALICESLDYHNIVFSMKSSNPQVMVQAYRLLTARMKESGMNYPLHLGVTEAGEGEDGRVKSALGIGTLLADGIGDTIRVSLTEEPEYEIPVAKMLLEKIQEEKSATACQQIIEHRNPFEYKKRDVCSHQFLDFEKNTYVMTEWLTEDLMNHESFSEFGYAVLDDQLIKEDAHIDFLHIREAITLEEERCLKDLQNAGCKIIGEAPICDYPYIKYHPNIAKVRDSFIEVDLNEAIPDLEPLVACGNVFVFRANEKSIVSFRYLFALFDSNKWNDPVFFKIEYTSKNIEKSHLEASYEMGSLLLDGYGNGISYCFGRKNKNDLKFIFTLLQASRLRITKTDFISCPSCGRTLFDLQSTTEKIREKTDHLKGLKIAIMGCIVNGPGEMADADFGYVGSAPGKVNLYVGKELVEKGIEEAIAVEKLIALIKEHNRWIEPKEEKIKIFNK